MSLKNNNSVYHRFSSFCMHFVPLDKFIIISVVQIRYLDDVLSHRAVELLTELLDCTQGFGRTLGDFVLFLSIPNFLYWIKILQSIWNISEFWYLKPVHFHLLYLYQKRILTDARNMLKYHYNFWKIYKFLDNKWNHWNHNLHDLNVKSYSDLIILSRGQKINFIKGTSNQFNLTNYFVIRNVAYQHKRDAVF